jgi:hypothetical protein
MTPTVLAPVDISRVKRPETEQKFAIAATRTDLAIRLLDRLCDPDPEFAIGTVSSIYFDTREWDYLGEKRNSDYLKTKVRLRWYEQLQSVKAGSDRSFAEVKSRTGSTRTKLRIPTQYTGKHLAAIDLHDPELLRVPAALVAAGVPIRHTLFPAFIVRYTRRRYIERSTRSRIAIDYAITAPKVNKFMLPQTYPCRLEQSVLEVKGTDAKFPVGLMSVFQLGFQREAFSKYFECYRHLTQTVF